MRHRMSSALTGLSMKTPRTISSSVRRDQSSASRLVRNVFADVGHPCFRMTAFQVPEGVFTRVATGRLRFGCVPKLYLRSRDFQVNSRKPLNLWWAHQDSNLEPRDY